MKRVLVSVMYVMLGICCYGQKHYKVLGWNAEPILNTYLIQQMQARYAQRDLAFNKALGSEKAMLAYRDSCKTRYIKLIGKMPAASAFNAQIVGSIKMDGYHIEKVIFESFAHHHVTASLYIPDGKGRFPAAVLFCGHEAEAKATESYQKTAILFAKHGFVVLMADPISQGERYQLTEASGKPSTKGGTVEHILLNVGSNLVGTNVAAYELWDNIRSLDYLLSRPEVDKNRVGCLGNSGGGTQTAYMIAYDNRIKVSALCSYVLNSVHSIEIKGTPDGCVPLADEVKQHLEDIDYFTMFAPKPVIVLAGRFDFVNYSRVAKAYADTKKVYDVLHQPDKVNMLTVDDGHGISQPKREAAVTWFRRWLCNDAQPVKEGNDPVHTSEELNCTPSGQANSAYADEITIDQHNIKLADSYATNRNAWAQKGDAYLSKIKNIAGINLNTAPIQTEWVGDTKKDDYIINKVIVRKPGEIPIPCLVVYPTQGKSSGKVALWLPQQGKNKVADSSNFIRSYMEKGDVLIMADLRGLGEETDKPVNNDSPYFNHEYREANLAIELGKPLTGQRAQDIFTLLDFIGIDPKLKNLKVEVYASGFASTAALHAAAFDKRIQKVWMFNTIKSYYDILRNPLTTDQYPYVIPNALAYYDLPDLVNIIGNERVKYE